MNYYLIDASAFVYAIEHLNRLKINIFLEKTNGTAFLYIPQFCIPEVFNTFAKFFYNYKNIGSDKYTEWRNKFSKLITDRRILYCYDLHRYHNWNTNKVYDIEHSTPYKKGERYLSAFDILIIAMGIELKHLHSANSVSILTRDGRLHRISNMSKDFAPAIWFE